MNDEYQLIVSGGSVTNGGWDTWKDFVSERYDVTPINLAQRGQGNEVIITKAILESRKHNNPLLAVMLTSVDKWDWYVQESSKLDKLNKEKHPTQPIHEHDNGGFWCTGSWFPEDKEYYKKYYYSIDYQIIKTCMLINHLQSYCKVNKIPCVMLYDSPIFEYKEQELLQGPKLVGPKLVKKNLINSSTQPFVDMIGNFDRGLIGYCDENNMPWYNESFKSHPGSLAHYRYCQDIVFPRLDNFFSVVNPDLENVANKMDKLWYEV